MAKVRVEKISKGYGALTVVEDVSISFPNKGFYALLGPSGSGKTTILRMIAGFEYPDAGRILIAGNDVSNTTVEKRDIGMVFQNYALFSNMNVFDNIAFGLKIRGVSGSEVRQRVDEVLELVRLDNLGQRRIGQLSGGQKQRIALARALVTRPQVLLLDEPLSALDKSLRTEMQLELKRIQRDVGVTTIFVTHDQEEALTLSDRIGILNKGKIIQEGPPLEIYERPNSMFAASFLGEANFFRGKTENGKIRLVDGTCISGIINSRPEGMSLACAVRPEKMYITAKKLERATGAENSVLARVSKCMFAGNSLTYIMEWNGTPLHVFVQNQSGDVLPEGQEVMLNWAANDTVVLTPDEHLPENIANQL